MNSIDNNDLDRSKSAWRSLAKPPIVFAVLEAKFNPNKNVQLSELGALAESLKLDFPKQQQIGMQEFGFQAGTHNEPVANFNSQQVGYKLSTESGNRSMRLELGSFAVAFNGGYYPNWPGLSDFFNEHLYRYLQHSKQSQFTRIGLRVANRLSFPLHESANTSEYLKTDIRLPQIPGFPSSVEHFRTEASVPFQNGYSCRIVQHTDGVEVNEAADTAYLNFVLDTDAARVVDFGVKDVSFLEETFHQLREIKNLAFFGTFTDKALSRYE